MTGNMADDTKDRTLWCGNLHGDVTEELLYELFLQSGPVEGVKIPMSDGKKKAFAFITFKHSESVPFTVELMRGTALMGQQLRLQFRSGSIHESGGGRSYGGHQQNQMQNQNMNQRPRHHGNHGNSNMNQGNVMGLMANPMGMPSNFSSPLRPPMAGMLANTGFHRSMSTPDFYNNNPATMMQQPGQMMNRQQSQSGNMYPQQGQHTQQGHQNQRGSSRDSSNPTSRHSQHRSEHGSGGSGNERSRSHDRGHDRHGNSDHDRKRRHHGGNGGDQRQSRQGGEADVQKRASQNFRRQMASPPWKKTVPPWEQN